MEVICQGPLDNNQIAITFDDGPCNKTTEILENLIKNKVKATFFFIGENVEKNREIVERIHTAGYTIGNHSYTHKAWFPLMRSEKIKNEIYSTQEIIKQITGSAPRYFRPPFAITNPFIAKALHNFDLKIIGWSIRSLDTVKHDPEKILNRIKSRLKPGSIVLLHDTSPYVLPVLESLLLYCRQQNFKPVTIEEFFQQKKTDD
jgi:peptidoglycan/xylan/chitin deacetylase (PgdA/CDA1 family)